AAKVDASTGSTRSKLPRPSPDSPVIPGYAITGIIATGGMGVVYAGAVSPSTVRWPSSRCSRGRTPSGSSPSAELRRSCRTRTSRASTPSARCPTADLLKARPTPQYDLPRWVQVFEQVAQAVGFAHNQGVIHRDLKPLNVMVGSFGEVQVMDWGLARLQP